MTWEAQTLPAKHTHPCHHKPRYHTARVQVCKTIIQEKGVYSLIIGININPHYSVQWSKEEQINIHFLKSAYMCFSSEKFIYKWIACIFSPQMKSSAAAWKHQGQLSVTEIQQIRCHKSAIITSLGSHKIFTLRKTQILTSNTMRYLNTLYNTFMALKRLLKVFCTF